jgi:hypothetical protein
VVKLSEESERLEERVRMAVSTENPDLDGLLSDLEPLGVSRSRDVLERVLRNSGSRAVPLLDLLAGRASPELAVVIAELLGTVKDPEAAAALRRLASTTSISAVRKEARRGLHRLSSVGVLPPPEVESPPVRVARPEWSLFKALASPIDGAGNRGVWLGLERGAESHLVAMVLNDQLGIVDFFATEMPRARFDREAAELLGDHDMPWVEMPEDYCRHLMQEAHGLNARTGTPLLPDFIAWRGVIGRPEQTYDQPLIYSVMNAAEVRWDPRNLDRSGDLMQLEMLQSWVLDKEEIDDAVHEMLSVRQSGITLAGVEPEVRERMVVDKTIQTLFDAGRRALYKRRLEEMAYHLWKLGWLDPAKLSLAAALGLERPDSPIVGHPFIRAMVEWSLGVGAAMVEEERQKSLGPGAHLQLPY